MVKRLMFAGLVALSAAHGDEKKKQGHVFMDGDDWERICHEFPKDTSATTLAECLGLTSGMMDGLQAGAAIRGGGFVFCLPQRDMKQVILVLKKYLADHPEDLHETMAGTMAASLRKSFPCPE